jgi:hypothetical protein
MSPEGKLAEFVQIGALANDSLRKLRETLLEQRERLETQIAVVRMQAEEEERKQERRKPRQT